jgi:uncharacterized protein (TIGR03382 family)
MALLCLALATLTLPQANAQTVSTVTVPNSGTSPFNTTNVNNIVSLGGIAVDSSGDVFVGALAVNSVTGDGEILEFKPTTTTPPFTYPDSSTTITISAGTQCMLPDRLSGESDPTVFSTINQMTADKNGNIYVADNSGPIWMIPKGSTSATCITNISKTAGSNTVIPAGIALDSNLNVFVSDNSNNVVREYLNSESYSTAHLFYTATSGELGGLAIDSQNNLYVVNTVTNTVLMFTAESSSSPTTIFSPSSTTASLVSLLSVSALPNGDLIVIDDGGEDNGPAFVAGNIFKLTPASPQTTPATFSSTTLTLSPAIPSGFDPLYAAADSSGDVFFTETSFVVINNCASNCANTALVEEIPQSVSVTVSSLNPTSGSSAGGTSVTITGTNFTSPATVNFGAAAATDVTINSATSITATSPAGSGKVDVTVTTTAGTSSTSTNDQFTYDASGPTATTAIASEALTEGHAASFKPVNGSGGTTPLSFSVSGLPSGLSMASATGTITGTPAVTLLVTSFNVTVTDADSQTATARFDLTVNSAVTATQVISSETLVQSESATSFTPVTGSRGTGTLSYSALGLPNGLSISPTTGAITGTPTVASVATTFTVTVTDSNGATASQSFVLTVLGLPTVIAPTASPINFGQPLSDSILSGGSASFQGNPVLGSFTFATPTTVPPVGMQNQPVTFTPTNTLQFATVSSEVTVTVNPPNYVVNTNQDDTTGTASNCTGSPEGTCTLRDALAAALVAGGANITFSSTEFATAQTITLTNGTLNIPANTTVTGPGVSLLTVSGNSAARVFSVGSGVTASISAMTIANGFDSSTTGGGGIFNAGTLSLSSCTVTNNQQSNSGAGAGIFNDNGASLTINRCTLSNNVAAGISGQGAGLFNAGTATITSSTFSGNTATGGVRSGGEGGAINNGNGATLTLVDSTLTGNQVTSPENSPGTQGGAIFNLGALVVENSTIAGNSQVNFGAGGGIITASGPGRSCTLSNTILAGNTDTGGTPDGSGACTASFTLIGNGTGITGISNGVNGNQVGTSASPISPMLAPLGNYGGPTQTLIPLPGSIAICAGSSSVVPNGTTTDQRGMAFNAGGYCPAGSVDSGAVQTNYALSFSTNPPANVLTGTSFGAGVTLDESGSPFVVTATPLPTITIPLTLNGRGTLTGGSAAINDATGIATYSGLQVSQAGNDTLTATLTLNPAALSISATSSTFDAALAVPTVTSISPNSGPAFSETVVTITGTNFTNATAVDFAGNPATDVTVVSNTQITAISPSGIGVVNVTVTTPGGTSATTPAALFTYAAPPTLAEAFSPSTINIGGTSTLTFTITNPNAATLTGVSFTDALPVGLTVATPSGLTNSCGGTVTATAGGTIIVLSGAIVPANGPCALSANVTAITSGSKMNTTSAITSTQGGTGNNAFSQLIVSAMTLLPAAGPLAGGTVASAYSQQFTASNGASPYTYTLSTGSIPAGLTLNSTTGLLSGTPTAGGSFGFSVQAEDINSNTVTQAYTLNIAAPTIGLSPNSLPGGTYGTAYSQAITASGGTAPYTYQISAGSLPAGLTLNSTTGVLSGTPSAAGTSSFTVEATDSSTVTGHYSGSIGFVLPIGKAATTTTLGVSSLSITPGQNETLTAQVTSTTTGTPTGTVSFYDGASLLSTAPLSGGAASYSTTALAPGVTHVITATYNGDTNFTASTSTSSASITVAPLDFTMTIDGSSSATVVPGRSITYQVTVTPDYGSYAGTVNFAISGLPPGATATFSPSSIAANGGAQTVTVTIQTASATALNRAPPPSSSGHHGAPISLALLALFGLGGLRRRGRGLKRFLCIIVLLTGGAAATLSLSGCGSDSGFFDQAPQNYNITITATAANLQHSAAVMLNVQ